MLNIISFKSSSKPPKPTHTFKTTGQFIEPKNMGEISTQSQIPKQQKLLLLQFLLHYLKADR
jgi:hypothetical protein